MHTCRVSTDIPAGTFQHTQEKANATAVASSYGIQADLDCIY